MTASSQQKVQNVKKDQNITKSAIIILVASCASACVLAFIVAKMLFKTKKQEEITPDQLKNLENLANIVRKNLRVQKFTIADLNPMPFDDYFHSLLDLYMQTFKEELGDKINDIASIPKEEIRDLMYRTMAPKFCNLASKNSTANAIRMLIGLKLSKQNKEHLPHYAYALDAYIFEVIKEVVIRSKLHKDQQEAERKLMLNALTKTFTLFARYSEYKIRNIDRAWIQKLQILRYKTRRKDLIHVFHCIDYFIMEFFTSQCDKIDDFDNTKCSEIGRKKLLHFFNTNKKFTDKINALKQKFLEIAKKHDIKTLSEYLISTEMVTLQPEAYAMKDDAEAKELKEELEAFMASSIHEISRNDGVVIESLPVDNKPLYTEEQVRTEWKTQIDNLVNGKIKADPISLTILHLDSLKLIQSKFDIQLGEDVISKSTSRESVDSLE